MAGIIAEKTVCEGCGVDVREGSIFCYSCGEAISGVEPQDTAVLPTRPLSGNGQAPKTSIDSRIPDEAVEEFQPIPMPSEVPESARSLPGKRRTRAYNRRPNEVVWVEREGLPKAYFIVSILFIGFVVILILLALYIR
jgi:hypothetical protein